MRRSITRMILVLAMLVAGLGAAVQSGAAEPELTVTSATFSIYVAEPWGYLVSAHRIMGPWEENVVNWLNQPGHEEAVVDSQIATTVGWLEFNVTSLVQGWLDNPDTNYGLLLKQGDTYRTQYRSSEYSVVDHRPKLEIQYSVNGEMQPPITIQRPGPEQEVVADAIIYAHPSWLWWNGGMVDFLDTGLVDGHQKYSLLRFEMPEFEDEECYEFDGETAWAANGHEPLKLRYTDRGNWATYVEYAAKTTTLFAGRTIPVGTVEFSAVVDGHVTITVNLTGPWEFEDVSENLKIQDYATAPSGNPAPGLFAHKMTCDPEESSCSMTVPANYYYGVHVNVGQWVPVPCP